VTVAGTKLTTYFSERTRAEGGFLADRLIELYAREAIHTSVLLRGADGFGRHHRLHTDRQLSASENLPAVSIAVDASERIDAVLGEVRALVAEAGLVTVERAMLLDGADLDEPSLPASGDPDLKLTLYGGRSRRVDRQAGYVTALGELVAMRATGASILLAVDGTLHGERRRARFLARNAHVPLMAIAVGPAEQLLAALPGLAGRLDTPVATLERVQVCRADGRAMALPDGVPALDPSGRPNRQKLTVHVEEGAAHDGHPIHSALLLGLREGGLAGVTVLRGIRGFYGGREPSADRLLSLRRRAPVLLVAVDTPDRIRAQWPLVSELTREHGLVTSELVPAAFTSE
jgi:PII-like signaling protein